jgi:hypothetical protein
MGTIKVRESLKPREPWSKDTGKITTQTGDVVSYKKPSYKLVEDVESTLVPKEEVFEKPEVTKVGGTILQEIGLKDPRGIDMAPTLEGQAFMRENLQLSGEKMLNHLWENNLIEFGHNIKVKKKPGKTWMQSQLAKLQIPEAKKLQMKELMEQGFNKKSSTINMENNIKIVQELLDARPDIVEKISQPISRWETDQSSKAIIERALAEEGTVLKDSKNKPYTVQNFNRKIIQNTSLGKLYEARDQVMMTPKHDLLILEALDKATIDPKGTGYGVKANILEFINNDPQLVARAKELGVSDILGMPKEKLTQRANKLWKGSGKIMKNPEKTLGEEYTTTYQNLVDRILEAGSGWGKKKKTVRWDRIPEGTELTNNKFYLDQWNQQLYNQKISFTPQYSANILKVIRNSLDKNAELEMADAFLPEMQNVTVKNFWDGLTQRKRKYNENVYKTAGKKGAKIDTIIDEHITPVWASGNSGLSNRQFIFNGTHGGSAHQGLMKFAAGIKEGGGKKGLRQKGYIDVLLYKLNQKIQNAAVEGKWDVVNSAVNNKGKIMDYVNSLDLYKVDMAVEPGKLYKINNKPTWRSDVTRENFRSDADYARYQDAINKNSVSRNRYSKLNDLQRLEMEFDLLSQTTGQKVLEGANFEEGGLVPSEHIQSSLASMDEVLNGIY